MPIRADEDWRDEQARHNRRMQLMRMQGDIDRQQRRVFIGFGIAGALAVIALLLALATS